MSKFGSLWVGMLHKCVQCLRDNLSLLSSQSAVFSPCDIQIFKTFEIKHPYLSLISLNLLKLFFQNSHVLPLLWRISQSAFFLYQFLNGLFETALETTHKESQHVQSESIQIFLKTHIDRRPFEVFYTPKLTKTTLRRKKISRNDNRLENLIIHEVSKGQPSIVLHFVLIKHYLLRLKQVKNCRMYEQSDFLPSKSSKFLIQNPHQIFFRQYDTRLLVSLSHCCLVNILSLIALSPRKTHLPRICLTVFHPFQKQDLSIEQNIDLSHFVCWRGKISEDDGNGTKTFLFVAGIGSEGGGVHKGGFKKFFEDLFMVHYYYMTLLTLMIDRSYTQTTQTQPKKLRKQREKVILDYYEQSQSLSLGTLRTSIIITLLTAKILCPTNSVSASTAIPGHSPHPQIFHRMPLITAKSVPVLARPRGALHASHDIIWMMSMNHTLRFSRFPEIFPGTKQTLGFLASDWAILIAASNFLISI